MLYGDKLNDHSVNVGQALIIEIAEETLLGVNLDKRLSFETHTQQLCVKGSQKLHALASIPFYGLEQACSNNECIHNVTI